MSRLFYLTSFAFGLTNAASIASRQATEPSVTTAHGTVVGQTVGDGLDNFLGIPFAQPPVKELRLRPPQPITKTFGTLHLPTVAASCWQQDQRPFNTQGLPNSTIQALKSISEHYTGPQSEDCLTINVQRPTGTAPDAKLPVMFWIYGGAFEVGNTAEYDGTEIVNTSIAMKTPIIYVTANYRVGTFGFLAGKELQHDGSSNLGLKDQRLAMRWVADNIAAFGGDPNKVTLAGESGGAASVYTHLFAYNGDNTYHGRPLFRGAIMDSGSGFPTLPVDTPAAQEVYDDITSYCGCAKAPNTLECLRSVPVETLQAAQNVQPGFTGGRGLSLSFTARPDPLDDFYPVNTVEATQKGRPFAHVPIINGDQEDEGTFFAIDDRNLTTTESLVAYLRTFFPNARPQTVADLVATYPADPAAGSPFRTGTANQLYPEFKRLAAIEGDIAFTLQRRIALQRLAAVVPAWSFLQTFDYGLPFLGTYHTSDVAELFGEFPNAAVGTQIEEYYVNFVNSLDPNGHIPHRPFWPRYDDVFKTMLNISSAGYGTLHDTFRWESYKFIAQHSQELLL